MAEDAVSHLSGQVQAPPVPLQLFHHPHALLAVDKPDGGGLPQGVLPGVPKGGMAQVVAHGDGLDEVLVQAQAPSHRPGNLVYLQGMGEAGAVVVPLGEKKHLGLVHQPPEGVAVDDFIPVPLVGGANGAFLLRCVPPRRFRRKGGVGRKALPLQLLGYLPYVQFLYHAVHPFPSPFCIFYL